LKHLLVNLKGEPENPVFNRNKVFTRMIGHIIYRVKNCEESIPAIIDYDFKKVAKYLKGLVCLNTNLLSTNQFMLENGDFSILLAFQAPKTNVN
jgi:hypothetical protein